MRGLLLISVLCVQWGWSYGYPANQQGVGAYAYQDSAGNRYGGTYGLKDGQDFNTKSDDFLPFEPTIIPFQDITAPGSFQDLDDFFPDYFRNFENLLQEAFGNQLDHQKLALDAARKAFDLTSNRAGYIPNSDFRLPFGGLPGFGGFGHSPFADMPSFGGFGGPNSAFAGGAAGPGFTHQVASISPMNPNMKNVDVTNFSEGRQPGNSNFYSVSSKSYSSSSNLNGQEQSNRGAETVVNNNGMVTRYSVNS